MSNLPNVVVLSSESEGELPKKKRMRSAENLGTVRCIESMYFINCSFVCSLTKCVLLLQMCC